MSSHQPCNNGFHYYTDSIIFKTFDPNKISEVRQKISYEKRNGMTELTYRSWSHVVGTSVCLFTKRFPSLSEIISLILSTDHCTKTFTEIVFNINFYLFLYLYKHLNILIILTCKPMCVCSVFRQWLLINEHCIVICRRV